MLLRPGLACGLFLPLLAGCGSDSGPTAVIEKVAPVSGTLKYQGKPLEFFQVTFLPTDGRRPATGVTDAEGKFTLGTNTQNDGAPPGQSRVTVVFVGPPPPDTATEVPIEDPALLPKPKIKIPAKYANPDTSGLTQNVPEEGITDLNLDLQ
jgi:hypothetical protein